MRLQSLKLYFQKHMATQNGMEAHAKRTGVKSMDAFFVKLPTGTAMIVVRDPKESLDKWYQSDHPDEKGHLEEAMKIFGMTEADLAATNDELEFEQVVEFKADY